MMFLRFFVTLVLTFSINAFRFATRIAKPLHRLRSQANGGDFKYDPSKIRNFCIIAHIDHGKSTLADRLLEYTKTVASHNMQEQLLDGMDLERERGITIKLQAARMKYQARNGEMYLLNLIDTPGHVDFGYEVSRSLAACEGAILVVDSTQGVEAQTLANVNLALANNLQLVTVLNKIDLPTSNPEAVIQEIEENIGIDCKDTAVRCSAKTGEGIEDVLEAIVHQLPPPKVEVNEKPFRGLIFDSYYDTHKGVVVFFRVVDGQVKKGDKIRFLNSKAEYEVLDLGVMVPQQQRMEVLRAGEVGFFSAGIRTIDDARVGDTIANVKQWQQTVPLPGYEPAKQMVFAGLYPSDTGAYNELKVAIEKLKLNDAALSYTPEQSEAMGNGFRCGFLGLLHMDITQERLEREYNLDLVVTAPSVVYKVVLKDGEEVFVDTPSKMPESVRIDDTQEPYVRLEILTPTEYIGALKDLAINRRGEFVETKFVNPTRSALIYEIPLAEVITDFFDKLKSRSQGYASMSFQDIGYRSTDLVKLDIKVNGEEAPPLSTIVPREKAHAFGAKICEKLKDLIPRQQIKISIQACIGNKVVAVEHMSALSKDVLAKCYGGDLTRKRKLLDKQAKGKKRMKEIGTVSVPQEAFMAVVKIND